MLAKKKVKPEAKPDIAFEVAGGNLELKKALEFEAKKALARKSFYYYCRLLDPSYYTEDRTYLRTYCDTLQALLERRIYSLNVNSVSEMKDVVWIMAQTQDEVPQGAYRCSSLIINMPPQHFKSRTLTHFVCWALGRNNQEHIISVSYNQDLANTFSKYTRDEIDEKKKLKDIMVFSDAFPTVRLKQNDKSAEFWAVEGSHFSYAAAGLGSSITGRGATIKIVDDPVKNDEIAFNEVELDKQYDWFNGTLASRKDANVAEALTIVNMTCWSQNDLTHKILDSPDAKYYYRLKFSAYDEEKDEMLCESVLSKEAYMRMLKNCQTDQQLAIFMANYNQEIITMKNALYGSGFHTYTDQPRDEKGHILSQGIKAKVDVADKGADWLCAGCYNEYNGIAYMLDVLYTQEDQSLTEDKMVDFIMKNGINEITFESNSGGGNFGRRIEEKLTARGWRRTRFLYNYETSNKETRIITGSANVLNSIYMPSDWRQKWDKFATDVIKFQRIFKNNKHDDGPDMLTMIGDSLETVNQSCIVECV